MTKTLTLAQFLLDRITEDEETATAATAGPWAHGTRQLIAGAVYQDDKCAYCHADPHPLTWAGVKNINGRVMRAHVHTAALPWWEENIYALRDSGNIVVVTEQEDAYMEPGDAAHIVRWDPTRALAEASAKRAIVNYYLMLCDQEKEAEVFGYHATGLKVAIRKLAAVHQDHPDYNPAWEV